MRSVTINKNDANQRLDKFLTKYLPSMPRSMIYKSLRKKCVKVNGKHIRDGEYVVCEGDTLELYLKDEFFARSKFVPTLENPTIIYEDDNILVLNKAAGTVVHADDKGTKNTLVEQVRSYLYRKGEYRPESEHSFAPSLANRLDRNTSGLVIAAKNAESLRIINEKIKNREVRKLYLAVIEGHLEHDGKIEAYLTRGEKIVTVSDTADNAAKAVSLECRTIENTKNASIVEIELHTGRTHQIRSQLAHIGHPLLGDKKYGSECGGGYKLCAYRLIFAFESNAGKLNYLKDAEFTISPKWR